MHCKKLVNLLESTDKKVIAAGGVIRIANSCTIKDGKLIDINFPKNAIVRGQILEYLRVSYWDAWPGVD
jgi:hypothetical protein